MLPPDFAAAAIPRCRYEDLPPQVRYHAASPLICLPFGFAIFHGITTGSRRRFSRKIQRERARLRRSAAAYACAPVRQCYDEMNNDGAMPRETLSCARRMLDAAVLLLRCRQAMLHKRVYATRVTLTRGG